MPNRRFPDWLDAYLKFTTYSEAPEQFHFWVGVGTVAAALRRKVYIDQIDFKWTPNFFIVIVAPPGTKKSSSIGVGEDLLSELGTIKLGPDATTWQGMIKLHSEHKEMIPMPDGTFLETSAISYFSSELGSLVDFQDSQMIAVLCDLWDGKPKFSKITAHSGSFKIGNPWVNIIAATTPSWFSENLPRSMLGGGFVARCVFLHGNKRRHLAAYPRELRKTAKTLIARDDILADLEKISMMKGEFELSPEAVEFGTKWYADLDKCITMSDSDEWKNYLGRKQTHVHKLAMVLSASRSDSMRVEEGDLKRSVKLVEGLETGLPDMFRRLQSTPSMEKTFKLVELVKARGSIPLTELYKTFFRLYTIPYTEFDPILDSAVRSGMLIQVLKAGVVYMEAPHP